MWAVIFSLCLARDTSRDTCAISKNGQNGTNNADDWLNPDCNFGGVCWDWDDDGSSTCGCCKFAGFDECGNYDEGEYQGENCNDILVYLSVTFGYNVLGKGVICEIDGVATADPSLLDETVKYFTQHGFRGQIITQPCQVCTPSNPCVFDTKPDSTEGIVVKFGIDLNTYYDTDCGLDDLPSDIRRCVANTDFGVSAYRNVLNVLNVNNSYDVAYRDIQPVLGIGSGVLKEVSMKRLYSQVANVISNVERTERPPTRAPVPPPTPAPTQSPTPEPTVTPTEEPTIPPVGQSDPPKCNRYLQTKGLDSSDIVMLAELGSGSSCRGGINLTWPGARTCKSPYIICLPDENTPAVAPWNETYFSKNHVYTLAQCMRECVYDQRCSGIEFRESAGECILIDDIPVEVVDGAPDATCYVKPPQSCNRYFEANDLNDTMLNCYCPNNRKGSYTKKVQRTVDNTRFCGDDESVDERIKTAQANRMFHLCENWCLFETLNPEQESWYYDPWKKCYRETYSGVGVHTSYCDRVIRNPNSIELQFVNERSKNLKDCQRFTSTPTEAPVEDTATTYSLSGMGESCDEACDHVNKTCAADQTARVFVLESDLINAFSEAGFTCVSNNIIMNSTRLEGYALPGLLDSRICANRQPTLSHLQDLNSDCHRILGSNSKRLCACY